MSYNWQTKIQVVKGIGPVRAKELLGLKIVTVGDLLEYRPSDWIFPGTTPIRDLRVGEQALISGKVVLCGRGPFGTTPFITVKVEDETGRVDCTFFGQIWLLSSVRVGMPITVWGKTSIYRGAIQFSSPKFSTCNFKQDEVAGGLYGVHSETIRAALRAVLADVEIPDWINPELCDRVDAFRFLHFPENRQQLTNGLDRLKFDELYLQQLAMAIKRKNQREGCGEPIRWTEKFDKQIESYFPYKFTEAQNFAIHDITRDLGGIFKCPMNRLLHGDVGSGKTLCAFYAAMLTALNNKRAIILVPTTILAQQHYDTLKGMGWDDCRLILGNSKEEALVKSAHVIIGTTAIMSDTALIKSVSLVVIDEQQKFGVQQRALLQKYGAPHVLLMSATPIPRTIALTVFGDLDVSTIKELPIKRGAVVTRWVLPDKINSLYEILEKELIAGHQAYIIYPRINDSDEDIISAEKGSLLIRHLFQQYNSELLTGRNSAERKTDVLRGFRNGDVKILVSTTIAEVGLDNPNATVTVIMGADRFGLSQLHQLRGRICRSTETAFCFLVASTANDTSIARLRVMEQTNDGFEIAEHDLRLRGPGEMFSTRQHGLPDLKFASLVDDYELLLEARELAKNSLDKLNTPEYNGVRAMLGIKFPDLSLVGVA